MEEKFVVEGSPHPLDNFPVLQVLFQCDLGVDSLRRNRMVSKSWLRACTKRWEQAEKYPVLDYCSGDCGPATPSQGNGISLMEFYDQFQAGVPYVVQMVTSPRSQGKLTLCRWTLLKNEMSPLDHWLWTSPMFQWVKRLTLSECRFSKEVWVFQESFLREVQNLEELTLKNCVVEDEALEAIRVANQQWMQHPGRGNWLQARRDVQQPHLSRRRLLYSNVPYYPEGYQHQKLTSLEVSLGQVEGQRAIRLWGPLLAMLPNLSTLKIRGYGEPGAEAGELPPLELTPMDPWRPYPRGWPWPVDMSTVVKMRFGYDSTIGSPPPTQRGYFWELFWFHEIGQVIGTLRHLDLLDFSEKAQDYGVLSTVEFASTVKDINLQSKVYRFPELGRLAFDLGLDPVFAERDLIALYNWLQPSCIFVGELVLYRAPFLTQFPQRFWPLIYVQRLELWGNVSNSLDFLRDCSNLDLARFRWNTTCYEEKWKGKRIHHLLREKNGRRANPLHKTDLVEATNWDRINDRPQFNGFLRLTRWEMDWRMELQSWRKLASVIPNLTWLKGLILGDEQLEEVVSLWPGLEILEMQHGCRVSVGALGQCLGKLSKLKKFAWRGCPCTRDIFGEEKGQDFGELFWGNLDRDKLGIEVELPWNDKVDHGSGCLQAAFESALLTGNSTEFFKLLDKTRL